jgi:hypothetical protein
MIAPDGTRLIFPSCGISYAQVVSVAGVNQRAAAKKLGLSERNFCHVIRRLGLQHWFPDTRPRSRCISREDIIKVAGEGWTRRDAAEILGISYGYLRNLIEEWKLQDYFISKAEAARVAQVGYAA